MNDRSHVKERAALGALLIALHPRISEGDAASVQAGMAVLQRGFLQHEETPADNGLRAQFDLATRQFFGLLEPPLADTVQNRERLWGQIEIIVGKIEQGDEMEDEDLYPVLTFLKLILERLMLKARLSAKRHR